MSYYFSIRGWLEGVDETTGITVSEIIKKTELWTDVHGISEDILRRVNTGWFFPKKCVGLLYRMYYGADINRDYHCLRDQLKHIAKEVYVNDGSEKDYLDGLFHVESEDREVQFIWVISKGKFYEKEIRSGENLVNLFTQ